MVIFGLINLGVPKPVVVVDLRGTIVSGFQTFLNKSVHLYLNVCKHWMFYCQRFENMTELRTSTTTTHPPINLLFLNRRTFISLARVTYSQFPTPSLFNV